MSGCTKEKRENRKIEISIADSTRTLQGWHEHLNTAPKNEENLDEKQEKSFLNDTLSKYSVKNSEGEISLLTLNFQLNQLLMIINNPMLFPHQAYVRMFNKEPKNSSDNEVVKIDKAI